MKTDDFDYDLPIDLIAQTPIEKRDSSRLMVVDRETGFIEHDVFSNIISYLSHGDVLVLNDTKVIPARLIGVKEETGAMIELLLLNNVHDNTWKCLTRPGKRVKQGVIISFGDGLLKAKCINECEDGIKEFSLMYEGILMEILDKLGTMPLPPYIKEKLDDKDRYQTVYAKNVGSVAAPTAGLHFTNELLHEIRKKGVEIYFITLHVGIGTFRPVSVNDVTKHKMHSESYYVSKEVADALNKAKKEKRNIIAVGTTTTRTLETVMSKYGKFKACEGDTDIFIYPGYEFKAIDGLITNFHLPKSTLIMLVSAFASKDIVLNAYKEAVNKKYRFFSFGDSMYIKCKKSVKN